MPAKGRDEKMQGLHWLPSESSLRQRNEVFTMLGYQQSSSLDSRFLAVCL